MQEIVMIKQQSPSRYICANVLHTVECARLPAKIVHERWRNHLYTNDRYNVFHLSLPLSTCITSSLCDPKILRKTKILSMKIDSDCDQLEMEFCNVLHDWERFFHIM